VDVVTNDDEEQRRSLRCNRHWRRSLKNSTGTRPWLSMNENRPSAATAESMVVGKRRRALGMLGVRATGAQVVPAR
jgi:hypothetical protein